MEVNVDLNEILKFGSSVFTDGLVYFVIRALLILTFIRLVVKSVHKGIESIQAGESAKMQLFFLDSFIKYASYTAGVFIILSKVAALEGIGKAVLGATSVFSVIFGLAAQEAMGNLIAGFSLILTRPFKTGDVITVPSQNITGTVYSVSFRHTVLTTADHDMVIVPNSMMNTALIRDLDYDQDYYSALIELSVAYESDTDLVRKAILEVCEKTPGVKDVRTPKQKKEHAANITVRFSDFLDSGIKVAFRVPVENFGDSFVVTSTVRENLLKKFKEYGIEIPYNKIQLVNNEKVQ